MKFYQRFSWIGRHYHAGVDGERSEPLHPCPRWAESLTFGTCFLSPRSCPRRMNHQRTFRFSRQSAKLNNAPSTFCTELYQTWVSGRASCRTRHNTRNKRNGRHSDRKANRLPCRGDWVCAEQPQSPRLSTQPSFLSFIQSNNFIFKTILNVSYSKIAC